MYAYAAMNLFSMICISIAAMVTAFYLPPWVPALLAALIYIPLVGHVFMSAADNDGDYKVPISALWKILAWIILVFAVIYWKNGLLVSGKFQDIPFSDALYFSISTWTTLVFGDISPPESIRLITSIEALLGYIGMGIYISVIGLWLVQRTEDRKGIHDSRNEMNIIIKNEKEAKAAHKEEKS